MVLVPGLRCLALIILTGPRGARIAFTRDVRENVQMTTEIAPRSVKAYLSPAKILDSLTSIPVGITTAVSGYPTMLEAVTTDTITINPTRIQLLLDPSIHKIKIALPIALEHYHLALCFPLLVPTFVTKPVVPMITTGFPVMESHLPHALTLLMTQTTSSWAVKV